MRISSFISSFLCFIFYFGECVCYKPVVFMHGIFAAANEAVDMFMWIGQAHPGTKTIALNLYENLLSTTNMMKQQEDVNAAVMDIMQANPDGIHLICYSQGGLLCRGVLEQTKHNVDSFISLSSPQAGQFGMTRFDTFFPNTTRDQVYKIAYTDFGQNSFSVSNYWNDPTQQTLYRQHSKYLAVLNNDTYNPKSQEWKANFLRLNNLVLIGGPKDGVITPWESSQFGFYDEQLDVHDMTEQQFYKYDTFGLRTLSERNATHVYTFEDVVHNHWYRTKEVFDKSILPYLT